MKKKYLFIFLSITIIAEIVIGIIFLNKNITVNNDTVKMNEIIKQIENDNNYSDSLEYVILDKDSKLIYKNTDSIPTTLLSAYQKGLLVMGITINNNDCYIIFSNNLAKQLNDTKNIFIISLALISCIQVIGFLLYYLYLERNVFKPFNNMKSFATRVANGNLDIPLEMDNNNSFGAFTEAFDVMRSELKKSRQKEQELAASKKELVAKLSHDIKTPIASIKAKAEIGYEVTDENGKRYFNDIIIKSDQVNTLVTNLLSSTLEDLNELVVNPVESDSYILNEIIKASDYLDKATSYQIPSVKVFMDRLRMQQVIDNIIANSYKYANTEINIDAKIDESYLVLRISDLGKSLNKNEIPMLLDKYKRGSNARDNEGAGLGLYISNYFMEHMNGKMVIDQLDEGFLVDLYLRII